MQDFKVILFSTTYLSVFCYPKIEEICITSMKEDNFGFNSEISLKTSAQLSSKNIRRINNT